MKPKFTGIEINSKDGQPINGKVPYPIWDDFKDLLEIERRTVDRKLTQWDFLMRIIKEGITKIAFDRMRKHHSPNY